MSKKSCTFAPDFEQQVMKKIFFVITGVCLSLGITAETVFTFTTDAMSQTQDGITVSLAQGSSQNAPKATTDYETQKPEMRLYVGNTITVSATANFSDIQLVCAKSSASNKAYAGLSASVGDLKDGGVAEDKTDWKIDHWTGDANYVVFTLTGSGQRRIQQLVVDGETVVIEPEQTLPTIDDLDWTGYFYQEPETIHVPQTQLFQKEYAFIDGNILVHCSKGSIVKASKDEDAYFGCQAEQTLTFTATDYIKGIAIKGNVRKAFSASTSKGTISYCSDPDLETAADPVLVVRNIDDWTVTITCDKNLSCYEVYVYFEENPSIACEEIEVPGETFFLDYDTASAYLDTDDSEPGKYIYSLYVWDKTNEWIYLTLDIITPTQGAFVGMYSIEDGNMTTESFFQYDDEDYAGYSYATEGQMVINKENGLYTISGYITCENKNTYNFSFTGVIEGGIDQDATGLKEMPTKTDCTKILRNGHILIHANGEWRTLLGNKIP